jgi:hypothetical protein
MAKANKNSSMPTGHEAPRSPLRMVEDMLGEDGTLPSNASSSVNDAVTNPVVGGIQPVRSMVRDLPDHS